MDSILKFCRFAGGGILPQPLLKKINGLAGVARRPFIRSPATDKLRNKGAAYDIGRLEAPERIHDGTVAGLAIVR